MSKFNAAVIGLGNIGLMYDFDKKRNYPSSHSLAYTVSDDFKLIFGIDPDNEKKRWLNKINPYAYYFETLDEAIAQEITNNLDVVSICTPPDTHFNIISDLIEKKIGKVIFCEKPISLSSKESEKIRDLASNNNIKIIPNISRRWNTGLRKVADVIRSGKYGDVEKINIRYTRGIYNTGSHLFDLLEMWTGALFENVMVLDKTCTTADPEPTYSFYFNMKNGVTGYAEAVNDNQYYMFDIDLFMSDGKIEMRNSGDDIRYFCRSDHHLFGGFKELKEVKRDENLLSDSCMVNAIDNIAEWLRKENDVFCSLENAIRPLYVAEALEKSYITKGMVKVNYE